MESPTIQQITSAGTVLGTAGYMSPEQVRGQTAGPASDIFSFGSVLYEMLAGKRAFEHDTSAETMTAILRHKAEAPRSLRLPQLVPPGSAESRQQNDAHRRGDQETRTEIRRERDAPKAQPRGLKEGPT